MSRNKLLCVENAKTPKGESLGYLTGVLYLAPHNLSGFNVCQHASPGCAAACLYSAGRGQMLVVQSSRIKKTLRFFQERDSFMRDLERAIIGLAKRAKREGLTPVVRLNGTSDLPWHRIGLRSIDGGFYRSIMERFPGLIMYDYTKDKARAAQWAAGKLPPNYHLTLSAKETDSPDFLRAALEQGINVAQVFHSVPKTHRLAGRRFNVLDGDQHDLRFLTKGRLVGLKAKGQAKYDEKGFVL